MVENPNQKFPEAHNQTNQTKESFNRAPHTAPKLCMLRISS